MAGFAEIIGHEQIIEHLQNAIKMDKISHAYILNGPDKSGKKLLAEAFAQTLQCEQHGIEPCMECHSCKQAVNHNQPDIIYVTHEKPNTLSVADIRSQLVNDVDVKPYSSRYKIYIVDEAEKMNQQAQNALLKTIEEPPAYVCVAFAQGNVGKAMALASSDDFQELKAAAVQLLKRIHEIELYEFKEAIKQINEYKMEINDYLDIMMIWFRDILLYKATTDVNGLIFKDEVYDIKKQASKSSYSGIEAILEALEKAKVRLTANVNFDLVMELLLLTIKEN